MVDGAYYDVVEAIKPGVRENELCAIMRGRLVEMVQKKCITSMSSAATERFRIRMISQIE